MNEIDLKRLAALTAYGRADETFEYSVNFDEPASKGASADHNQTNSMGDNPMKDVSEIEEDGEIIVITPQMLDKLHHILKGVGVADCDIAMGDFGDYDMNPERASRVHQLVTGQVCAPELAFEKVRGMCEQLGDKLIGSTKQLDEFRKDDEPVHQRFSHTIDGVGNVMVHDLKTDKQVYLQGSDALELIGALDRAGDAPGQVQQVLSQYQHVMESKPSLANLLESALKDHLSKL